MPDTLAFDIVGDAASAARAFRQTADGAGLAARGAKMASQALDLQTKSAQASAAATAALAKTDKILADAEREAARDAALLDAALSRNASSVLKAVQAITGQGQSASAAAAVMAASRATPSGSGGSGGLSGTGNGLADSVALTAIAMSAAARNTRYFSDYISQGTPVWDSARKGVFGLNGELALFGGALGKVPIAGTVSAVHLLADGIVETAGTLVPAAIAFGVFAAAAAPAVQDIIQQMKNLRTVSAAMGTQIPGLSGGFAKMAQAVQPEVYQLFGEGLVFSSRSTGTLSTLATTAGKVLDDLGARFVFATTQGKGFSAFADKASSDLAGWGNSIGNLGGIIGGLLRVMPGYAEDVLNVFGAVSHGIETVVNSGIGQDITGIGLAAHGAVTYIGILATGFAVLASRGLSAVAALSLNAATGLSGLGAAGEKAGAGMLSFAAKAEGAAALPWGWISIAVAGLGFLAYQLLTAKDAAQQFGASMQDAVHAAPLNLLLPTIAGAIGHAYQRLASSQAQLNAVQATANRVMGTEGPRAAQAYAAQVVSLRDQAGSYQQVLQGLDAEQLLAAGRVSTLSREYGGQTAALALMNAAGITSAQVTDSNNQHWAQAVIEIQAQRDAMNEMKLGTGRYAAAMNALGSDFVTTFLPNIQKVTQAEDSVFSVLIGGEQAFTGFAQSLGQMGTDAKKSGASLGGLNTASLTLASDFYSTSLPAAQKLIDSLQQQQVSTGNLTKAVATEAAQMLPYTKGNVAAKVAIIDLINNALGPGAVSLQDLGKWVGKNATTMQGFQSIVGQTQVKASQLAGVLGQDLNSMFAADVLQATHAGDAMNAYAKALVTSGADSDATRSARQKLITDLEDAGYSAQQAQAKVDGLQKQLDALHGKTVNVQVFGSGAGKITFNENTGTGRVGTGGLQFAATGGPVRGPGGPTSDSVPVMASAGEFVINAGSAAAIGLPALNALNSFATGGLVGPASVLNTGVPFAANAGAGFAKAVEAAFAQAAVQSLRKDVQASAASAGYAPGAGVAQWRGTVDKALAMLGLSLGLDSRVLYQMQTESGGDPLAVNRSDINWALGHPSVGLMQVIGPTFAAYAGPFRNTGPFAYGVSENPLANIFAGLNYAQHAYGPGLMAGGFGIGSGHGYAHGGLIADTGTVLSPGWNLRFNGTGAPEPLVRAGRGGAGASITIVLDNHGVIGSKAELKTWLQQGIDELAREGKLAYALRRSPSAP